MDNYLENPQNFLFYLSNDGKVNVQVIVDSANETIWTSQKGMSEIFCVEVPTINYHLKEVFQSGELNENSVIRKIRITAKDGKKYLTTIYTLDAIIAVGYRVNSYQATQFRIWATRILKEYLVKGFAETEYSKFRVIQDREYKSDFNILIDASHNILPTEESVIQETKQEPKYEIDPFLSQALNYNLKDKEPSE